MRIFFADDDLCFPRLDLLLPFLLTTKFVYWGAALSLGLVEVEEGTFPFVGEGWRLWWLLFLLGCSVTA